MKYVFPDSELQVEGDRCIVTVVCLNIDDVGAYCSSEPLQLFEHRCRDASTAMGRVDRKVVDVDLAASLLEFRQDVCGQPADNPGLGKRSDRDERLARDELLQVVVIRLGVRVGSAVTKGFA